MARGEDKGMQKWKKRAGVAVGERGGAEEVGEAEKWGVGGQVWT